MVMNFTDTQQSPAKRNIVCFGKASSQDQRGIVTNHIVLSLKGSDYFIECWIWKECRIRFGLAILG